MKRSVLMVVILVCLPQLLWANTRLGLHTTSDELTIWRARRTDNVNGSNGVTYQTMYNNRILVRANAFKNSGSHPFSGSDGRWNPSWASYPPTKSCFPNAQTPKPGLQNGLDLMASAFVFLLNGDPSDAAGYGEPVRQELLAQIAVASTDFADSQLWCVTNSDSTSIEIPGWPTRMAFAYDYIRAGGLTTLTNQNRIDIETWLNNAALYWLGKINIQVGDNVFPNRLSDNYTCSNNCPGTVQGTTYFGGDTVNNFHGAWSNRIANSATLVATVANLMNPSITLNATLGPQVKRYFEESIKYAIFPNGTAHEFFRWCDHGTCGTPCSPAPACGIGSAWTHAHFQVGPLVSVADHFGRAGDLSLYNYSSSTGLFGTGGTTKGLSTAVLRTAQMQNGTVNVYGTTVSGQNGDPNYLLNANVESGHSEDWTGMISNIRYQDSEVRTAMQRTLTNPLSCGGTSCYGGPWGVYLDIPFQWSNLDSAQVDPFTLGGGDPTTPKAPTNLHVVSP